MQGIIKNFFKNEKYSHTSLDNLFNNELIYI